MVDCKTTKGCNILFGKQPFNCHSHEIIWYDFYGETDAVLLKAQCF